MSTRYMIIAQYTRDLIVDAIGKDAPPETYNIPLYALALAAAEDQYEAAQATHQLEVATQQLGEAHLNTVAQLLQSKMELAGVLQRERALEAALEARKASEETRIKDAIALATRPARDGKKWTQYEEYMLVKLYRAGRSEEAIAKRLER